MATKTTLIIVFVALSLAYGSYADTTDQTTLENVWKCIQSKMYGGVPSIDFPSYDPFHQDFNLTFGIQFVIFKAFFTVENILIFGIPESAITIKQNNKDSDTVADIAWSVQWPSIFVDATWALVSDTNGTDVYNDGLMNMSLTDAFWSGTAKIQKPILKGTITELLITKAGVRSAEVGVTNFGEIGDFLFPKVFKYVWEYLLGSHLFTGLVQGGLQTVFQEDWLDQAERLNTLLADCTI